MVWVTTVLTNPIFLIFYFGVILNPYNMPLPGNNRGDHKIFFFIFILTFLTSVNALSQTKNLESKIVNANFPNSWDVNRELRGKDGQVLAWAHFKANKTEQSKSCLTLQCWQDSSSKMNYLISAKHSYEQPFNTWRQGYMHYAGLLDTHIKGFDHKPTEKELTDLILRWQYCLINMDVKTVEAGLDEKLWFDTFGFIPDKKVFVGK
jgi:hypothetical protein